MADADDVRRIALALPQVTEIDSDGFDFRVDGQGFVWSYPERRPGQSRVIRTDIAVLFVGDEAEKQALLLGEPEVFFTTPGYDGWPLVMLRLAEVDAGRLAELVTDAWRMRAPDALADESGRGGTSLTTTGVSLPPPRGPSGRTTTMTSPTLPAHRWGYELTAVGEGCTLVTETFDCSRSPEWLRRAVRGGDRWNASMTATLEKLDKLAARSAAGHPA
jgi:hypothetical protein